MSAGSSSAGPTAEKDQLIIQSRAKGNHCCAACRARARKVQCDAATALGVGCSSCRAFDIPCVTVLGLRLGPRPDGLVRPLCCDQCRATHGIKGCSWRDFSNFRPSDRAPTSKCMECYRSGIPCTYVGLEVTHHPVHQMSHHSLTVNLPHPLARAPTDRESMANPKASYDPNDFGHAAGHAGPATAPVIDPNRGTGADVHPANPHPAFFNDPLGPISEVTSEGSGVLPNPGSRPIVRCDCCARYLSHQIRARCDFSGVNGTGCTNCRRWGLICVVQGHILRPHPVAKRAKTYVIKCDACSVNLGRKCERARPCQGCQVNNEDACEGHDRGTFQRPLPGDDMPAYYIYSGFGPNGIHDTREVSLKWVLPSNYHHLYIKRLRALGGNAPAPGEVPEAATDDEEEPAPVPDMIEDAVDPIEDFQQPSPISAGDGMIEDAVDPIGDSQQPAPISAGDAVNEDPVLWGFQPPVPVFTGDGTYITASNPILWDFHQPVPHQYGLDVSHSGPHAGANNDLRDPALQHAYVDWGNVSQDDQEVPVLPEDRQPAPGSPFGNNANLNVNPQAAIVGPSHQGVAPAPGSEGQEPNLFTDSYLEPITPSPLGGWGPGGSDATPVSASGSASVVGNIPVDSEHGELSIELLLSSDLVAPEEEIPDQYRSIVTHYNIIWSMAKYLYRVGAHTEDYTFGAGLRQSLRENIRHPDGPIPIDDSPDCQFILFAAANRRNHEDQRALPLASIPYFLPNADIDALRELNPALAPLRNYHPTPFGRPASPGPSRPVYAPTKDEDPMQPQHPNPTATSVMATIPFNPSDIGIRLIFGEARCMAENDESFYCGRPAAQGCADTTHYGPTHGPGFPLCDDCDNAGKLRFAAALSSLVNRLRAYSCSNCEATMQDPVNYNNMGFRVWGFNDTALGETAATPRTFTTKQGGHAVGGWLERPYPITGCECAFKLLGNRICSPHRLHYLIQLERIVDQMEKHANARFGGRVCPWCLERPGVDHFNFKGIPGGEGRPKGYACLACNGIVVAFPGPDSWDGVGPAPGGEEWGYEYPPAPPGPAPSTEYGGYGGFTPLDV